MTGLRVTRWARFGKDRLYVMDGASRLGWYDLVGGELHVDDEARAAEVRAALAGHQLMAVPSRTGSGEPSAVPEQPPMQPYVDCAPDPKSDTDLAQGRADQAGTPALTPIPHASGDLAGNRPGQGVRVRAVEEREAQLAAHPILGRLARLVDAKTDERAWRVGADGEESVGRRLEKLTNKGWRVLHSVPVGERGSDIDHVLIGPGGVWTVNTKRHMGARVWLAPNQIRIDGHVQPYLRNSRFEAKRAADMLASAVGWTPPVRPAIVLQLGLLADPISVKQHPDDVDVIDACVVPRWFAKRPVTLTAHEVEALYAAARVPGTWRPSSVGDPSTGAHRTRARAGGESSLA